MDGVSSSSKSSCTWLPIELQLRVFSLLPHNDRVLSCRRVSRDAQEGLTGPDICTVFLSQPLPPYAARWAEAGWQQHVRQLPFLQRLQPLCTAAASGSEVNLEVALVLLQPSIFPELLHSRDNEKCPDPGVAAVEAGHPQLLGWLLRHCPTLLRPDKVLATAAQHCDLAGLQMAWEVLQAHSGSGSRASGSGSNSGPSRPQMTTEVLNAAAASVTPDAIAKMEWVLATGGSSCRMDQSTAVAAAACGDLARLLWLHERGCLVAKLDVLLCALKHAHLAVAQWLVDEAGCELPAAGAEEWVDHVVAAANTSDAVAKWQWLQQRGAPPFQAASAVRVRRLAAAAVGGRQVEAVQHLLSVLGNGRVVQGGAGPLSRAVALSGSVPVAECLKQAGFVIHPVAYGCAVGKLPFIRWLALEAKVSAAALSCNQLNELVQHWPSGSRAHRQDLLEAVQLVAGAGFRWKDNERYHTAKHAAARGDLDLVKFLLPQIEQAACPVLLMEVLKCAAGAGCESLLEFVVALPGRKAVDASGLDLYLAAAKHGDRATLGALRRLGVGWGPGYMVRAAVTDRCAEPVLRWLVEQGAPVGSGKWMEVAVGEAVRQGRLGAEAAAWLRGLEPRAEPTRESEAQPRRRRERAYMYAGPLL